jgi:hypothetical protein
MTFERQATCAYCGREMWRPGLEPCCDKPRHAGRLVCADVRGCVGVVLARLHEDDKPDQAGAQLEQIRLVLDSFDWETDDRQFALEQIDDIVNRDGAR